MLARMMDSLEMANLFKYCLVSTSGPPAGLDVQLCKDQDGEELSLLQASESCACYQSDDGGVARRLGQFEAVVEREGGGEGAHRQHEAPHEVRWRQARRRLLRRDGSQRFRTAHRNDLSHKWGP
jgi:hypothetical protein